MKMINLGGSSDLPLILTSKHWELSQNSTAYLGEMHLKNFQSMSIIKHLYLTVAFVIGTRHHIWESNSVLLHFFPPEWNLEFFFMHMEPFKIITTTNPSFTSFIYKHLPICKCTDNPSANRFIYSLIVLPLAALLKNGKATYAVCFPCMFRVSYYNELLFSGIWKTHHFGRSMGRSRWIPLGWWSIFVNKAIGYSSWSRHWLHSDWIWYEWDFMVVRKARWEWRGQIWQGDSSNIFEQLAAFITSSKRLFRFQT